MMTPRFTVVANAATAARNRGFDDAVAGRKSPPPVGDPQRANYLQGWRRGNEKREGATA